MNPRPGPAAGGLLPIPNHAPAAWAAAILAASLAWGCEAPASFAVPPGPAKAVDVDVRLPVYVVGNWTVRGFVDALRIELAKYRIDIVSGAVRPVDAKFEIDLGEVTYRSWESIEVARLGPRGATAVGSVRVPDLGSATVEAAAEPVAALVARQVWGKASGP